MTDLGAAFAEYEATVTEYAETWFRKDPSVVEHLRSLPRNRAKALEDAASGKIVGTDTVFMVGSQWLPARTVLQDMIVADLVAENTVPSDLPVAVLACGLPGSGKTSMLRPIAQECIRRLGGGDSITLDADDVRVRLPEYGGGLGSEVVQVETSAVTYQDLRRHAYAARSHLFVDIVGDPRFIVEDAEFLIAAGWSILCLQAALDVDIAVDRVMNRAIKSGRYVPLSYVRSIGGRPQEAYDALTSSGLPILGCATLDTSGAYGEAPVVLHTDSADLFGEVGKPTLLWPAGGGA